MSSSENKKNNYIDFAKGSLPYAGSAIALRLGGGEYIKNINLNKPITTSGKLKTIAAMAAMLAPLPIAVGDLLHGAKLHKENGSKHGIARSIAGTAIGVGGLMGTSSIYKKLAKRRISTPIEAITSLGMVAGGQALVSKKD